MIFLGGDGAGGMNATSESVCWRIHGTGWNGWDTSQEYMDEIMDFHTSRRLFMAIWMSDNRVG